MKPEIFEQWEKVLSDWIEVENLEREEKFEEAASKAISTFTSGLSAIKALSEEIDDTDLNVIVTNAFGEWIEREPAWGMGGKHHTPKENINWAQKTLKRLSKELPPDTFRAFE